MAPHTVIAVSHAGRNWNATFTVARGEVSVGWAYGSRRAVLGEREPGVVAEELLREIVEAWSDGRGAAAPAP